MGTGVWYGSRVPGMPYEITPFATKGVYRAPLLMVPPSPLGSCLGSRSTSARTGRQSHAWVRAVRAHGRDDSPPRSHGMRMHIGCTSIPPWAPPLPLRSPSRSHAWAHSSSLSEQARGRWDVRSLEYHESHELTKECASVGTGD